MTGDNYTIDVLLPVYNGGSYLKQQIESILNQSFLNFRLIVRDDGSSDNTCEIVDGFIKLDQRVLRLNDNLGNLGLVNNIENLLTYSSADLIFFTDQDDVWLPDKIETFLIHYKNDHIASLVHSNCWITDENLNVTGKFLRNRVAANLRIENSFFNYYVQGASTMINRKLKEVLLPFPPNLYIHDRFFHIMAEIFGKRTYIPIPTMYYRQHAHNLIGSNSLLTKIKNLAKKRKFYLPEDRTLFLTLSDRFPHNRNLALYLEVTDDKRSRMHKILLIVEKRIRLRIKELILLIINN